MLTYGHCKKHKVWIFLVLHERALSQWGEEWEKEAVCGFPAIFLLHQRCV